MLKLLKATIVAQLIVLAASAFATASTASAAGCIPGALKQRLAQISQKFGPVRVISSHRPGARIAGSGRPSYHASCRAVDFVPTRNYGAVVAWVKANHGGGIGTYSCGMSHIHIDTGPYVRYHHCVSAKGRPVGSSRYASRKRSRGTKVYAARSSRKASNRVASRQQQPRWADSFYKG